MALNLKDQYIDDIIKDVDNFFIRRRLREELSDHYDDSFAEEMNIDPNEAGRMVRENMGDPKIISNEMNQNDTTLISRIFRHRYSILISLLVLAIFNLGFMIHTQNVRQSQTNILIKSLQNQVDLLAARVDKHDLRLFDTNTRIDTIDESIQLIRDYSGIKYDVPGLYCCDMDYHTYNSLTNKTIITPPNIPLKIIVDGELPNYVKLFVTKSSFAIVYDNGKTNQILLSWTLVSHIAAIESKNSSQNINDLGNGFAVVRTFELSWILDGEDDKLANQFINHILSIRVLK